MPRLLTNTLRLQRRSLRLDTLLRLRWLAAAGQALVLLGVHFGLGYELPLAWAMAAIGVSVWLSIVLRLKYPPAHRLTNTEITSILAFDILQLTLLLYLTGGLENPFALMFLAPVLISASALPPRATLLLGALAMLCASLLAFVHQPLPWHSDEPLVLPLLFQVGVWCAVLIAMGFIGAYVWTVAEERRRLSNALTAVELVLAREQHLSALDGLAAAAAHELGTPLATIALVTKELERDLPTEGPIGEDIRLLREQIDRCRGILKKLTHLGSDEAPFDRAPMSLLLTELIAPHLQPDLAIRLELPDERGNEPFSLRNPGLLYGLGNIIENAADFAKAEVVVSLRWTDQEVVLTVVDDGPGFASDLLDRIGEPYVTTRSKDRRTAGGIIESGLGLGFFIAKTLLERSGARLTVANRTSPDRGAIVRIGWRRDALETADEARESGGLLQGGPRTPLPKSDPIARS